MNLAPRPLVIGFLLLAAAPAAAEQAQPLHPLGYDRIALIARYAGSGLSPERREQERKRIETALAPVFEETLARHNATLLLDEGSILFGGSDIDVTREIINEGDTVLTPVADARPIPHERYVPAVTADPHLGVVNTKLTRRDAAVMTLADAVQGVVVQRRDNLAIERDVVVLGLISIDVTQDVNTRESGGPPGPQATQFPPAIRFLTISRNRILSTSRAGQSIADQVHTLVADAEAEFKPRADALRAESESAHQAPDFLTRSNAFRAEVKQRQADIQAAVFNARKHVEVVLGPILQKIMGEDGANLLFDDGPLVGVAPSADITPHAVSELDREVSTVPLVLPHASVAP